jgi:hypothetical protein
MMPGGGGHTRRIVLSRSETSLAGWAALDPQGPSSIDGNLIARGDHVAHASPSREGAYALSDYYHGFSATLERRLQGARGPVKQIKRERPPSWPPGAGQMRVARLSSGEPSAPLSARPSLASASSVGFGC